ncbi:MAG: flagellar motor protein MotA [Hyphomicrobiales bacterium]|nr:flagellar motor protein MotA [Hyphomicrobiales bacterium]MDE1973832.1 flagellar motor protein MotA [Hyphomicrobiales bacterium]MDE2283011.1 flagellar motor protein MotA [Hyphomicrobiales bacterium]MDE2375027.1 flagellar motor protein MotA [Hyphomicrobiales bacterium]
MADNVDQVKLASPRIYLVRMLVFLILCGLIAFVLQHQILNAFMANPWLNGLIVGVLLIGIILSFVRVIRLFPEVSWVNSFRRADPSVPAARPPTLLAPMAMILGGERAGRMTISAQIMRAFLDSLASRLDEARDTSRYLTGLLVFLGLLGTFWGLIETVGSVGGIINNLNVGGDADTVFNALKEGLAAPLGGMGISFSSSLFGLAGSLILGFLDLQTSQAQNRFYNNLEDWLATTVHDLDAAGSSAVAALPGGMTEAIERLRNSINEAGSGKATTAAMANLAEAIQGLVQHMRAEQQMIRDWADTQSKLNGDIRRFMELLSRERAD